MKFKLSDLKVDSFITGNGQQHLLGGASCPHNTAGCCPASNNCPDGGSCAIGTDGCCPNEEEEGSFLFFCFE